MKVVKSNELKNNFDKYLQDNIDGNEFIIIKNGKEVARLITINKPVSYISDSLLGILKRDISEKK
jgi:prevent-host-death family protein